MSAGARAIDERLARRLIDAQFPQWRDLPVAPVPAGGVDNRTFRLGDELSVRLPSAGWYALQVEKEQRWLPVLAPLLPLPIPAPVAQGRRAMAIPSRGRCTAGSRGSPRAASASRPGGVRDRPRRVPRRAGQRARRRRAGPRAAHLPPRRATCSCATAGSPR